MQAKDIPDAAILDVVRAANEGRLPYPDERDRAIHPPHPRWANWMEVADAIADAPPKVVLAKVRSLLRRGPIHGCGCGCRGDLYLCGDPRWESPYNHDETNPNVLRAMPTTGRKAT